MQNLFIGENEEFEILFSVATNKEGDIFCDIEEKSLIESLKEYKKNIDDYTIGNYKITFKKPSFGDIKNIYIEIKDPDNEVETKYNKIAKLIKTWNLRGVENEEPEAEDIRKLHPLIASCIDIQLNIELGNLI